MNKYKKNIYTNNYFFIKNRLKQLETKKNNVSVQLEFHVKKRFVQRRVKEFFGRNLLDAGHKAQQFFQ